MIRELIDLVGGLSHVKCGIVEGLIWSVCIGAVCFIVCGVAPMR